MSHKWLLNGVTYNFCVKCGCKKSRASKWHRCMSKTANGKKLSHKIEEIEDVRYSWMRKIPHICVCKICGMKPDLYNNHVNIIWSQDNTGLAYVPYKIMEKKGKKIARHCKWWIWKWDPDRKKSVKSFNSEVSFWPIYCSLTEDEAMVRDILL